MTKRFQEKKRKKGKYLKYTSWQKEEEAGKILA